MKFTKGYWLNREGVENSDIAQIREVKTDGKCVYLYCVPYQKDERAVGGPMIEIEITSPLPDIIRLTAYHFKGSNEKEPQFELNDLHFSIEVKETDAAIFIKSNHTKLMITKNPCTFTYYYKDRLLTRVGNRFGYSMISTMKTPAGNFMRGQLEVGVGEKIYGLGERFTPFVKNGQVIDMWNEDGGTCSEISYKNIPFYLSSNDYGVFVNSSDEVSFEVCSEVVSRVQFSIHGEKLDYMVIGGENRKDIINHYTQLTGRPALPPSQSFGLWLTSSFTTSYDEKVITDMIDKMQAYEIPLQVFHFDCFWMKENEWCNFSWDERVFPDVKGMLDRLKSKGLKICVWINPYIAQKSPLFNYAKDNNYFLKNRNGDVWQWDLWQSGMGIVDFTNPNAYEWYQSKLKELLEQGVDYFKTDFGERIPTDVIYYDGSNPVKMHNYYTFLYNKCVFSLLEEVKGKNEACLFARSATVGGQRFPVHWGGDSTSNYLSMAETLRGGLSLGMSGFGFWSHDISGFEGTAPADVYKRWVAFGLLSSHSRLHGSNSYRVPWLFDEEAVEVLRFFTKLKLMLMPYIYTRAVEAHEIGIPVMRAMALEFEEDHACDELDRQYMLGDSILVAPVFSKNGEVDYYLPKGEWTHLLSGETYIGGEWKKEQYDFFSLPLFARPNSIIPFGKETDTTEYNYSVDITLHVYHLTSYAQCDIYDKNGKKAFCALAMKKEDRLTILLQGNYHNLCIYLHNEDMNQYDKVDGAQLENGIQGIILKVEDGIEKIELQKK